MDGAVVSDATASHCVNDQTSSEIELQRLRNELEAQRRSSEAVDVLAAELEEKKLEANQLRAALAREAEAHRTLRGQLRLKSAHVTFDAYSLHRLRNLARSTLQASYSPSP